MTGPSSPDGIDTELTRLARRWQQLPLGQALSSQGTVRAVVESYAALAHPGVAVADLGPGVVMSQLRVVVHDAVALGLADPAAVAADLAQLRHRLA